MNLGSVYLTMIEGGREVFLFFSRRLESTIILKIPTCFRRYNSLAAGFGGLKDFITFSAAYLLDVHHEPQPKESRFWGTLLRIRLSDISLASQVMALLTLSRHVIAVL